MKRWAPLAAILGLLALLVPYSSKRPDAVQRVLGLAGGADSAAKAAGGILAAVALAMGVGAGLRILGKRK